MSDYRTSYVRDLHTMAQVVHQAIGMALAGAGDWRALLDEALASMSTLVSDTAQNRDDGLQLVAWQWSTERGYCYDCGCPAAFWSDRYGRRSTVPQDDEKLCAVCAANAATKGETIQRIEPEHDESLCGQTQCGCPVSSASKENGMDTNANATTTDHRMTNLHEGIRQTIFSYNGEHVFCMLAQELDDVEPELAAVVRSAVASTNSPADSYEPSVEDRVRITEGAYAGQVGEVLSVGMDEVEIELDAGSIVRVDPQVAALEVHDEYGVYLACSRCGSEVGEGEAEAHYRWCGPSEHDGKASQ